MGPRAYVDAPLAAPPRVGLLASAIVDEQPDSVSMGSADNRWAAGFSFAPEGCGQSGIANPCGNAAKNIAANQPIVSTEPFVVWAGDRCSSFEEARDRQGRARRQLLAAQSYQVAQELWTGTLAKAETVPNGDPWPNRWLASEASDVLTAGPASVADALGCLEYGLGRAAHGARGMIHATRELVAHWWALNFLRREGNLVLTVHDTIVVPDAGYDGSGPLGQPATAGSQWAYATGMVYVRLSQVKVLPPQEFEAVNRADNTIEYRAEREAAVDWDGCAHLAVEVDQPLCNIGGPGS